MQRTLRNKYANAAIVTIETKGAHGRDAKYCDHGVCIFGRGSALF